jgi:hypothetical protein
LAGAGAGIAQGGDFDGHGVIVGDAQILPGVGGLVLAGQGGEKLGDGVFDRIRLGIVVVEEVRVFEVSDAGFGARILGEERGGENKEIGESR